MLSLAVVAVVVLHAAYLVFQMLGALLALRHRGWLAAHLVAVAWGVGIVVVQGDCPLTRLEKHLVERSGGTPYPGSFLDRYVFGTVLPDGTQAWAYGTHLAVILATYLFVAGRLRATSRPAPPTPAGLGA